MKIGIAGNGNVAWHLVQMLTSCGHEIAEVYSRTNNSISPQAELIQSPKGFTSQCEVIFIAVSDDAIHAVASEIHENLFVVHVSGNTSIDVLKQNQRGVVWPVQSLTQNKKTDYTEIPFLIEASEENSEKTLLEIFRSISTNVKVANSQVRAQVHLAAVFANNFVNRLFDISSEILAKEKLEFDILLPLIRNQVEKLKNTSPSESQTGPARRGDMSTIDGHLQLLKNDINNELVYRVMTNSILEKFYGKKL